MKLLLTSGGVRNPTIEHALVRLLGKPISECSALVVPTGVLPFDVGPVMAARLLRGDVPTPLTELGWASLGLLELTALPSIAREAWVPVVEAADALLVWGGDPVYLTHWMRESGLTERMRSLDSVYVGVSAGAMAATALIGETYVDPPGCAGTPLSSRELVFGGADGEVRRTFVTAEGAGLVDVSVIPHLDNPNHPDASMANAELWAAQLPGPTYALDDQSALVVADGVVEVVSEGTWRRFEPA